MKTLLYIALMYALMLGCNDKNDFIQNVYVNETIALDLYADELTPGESIFVEGGVEGIIIYRGVGNDYKVYDRNCSYEPSLSCSRIDSVNAGIAWCGCCPSVFDINNSGEPINAPALLPLKQYNWSFENNILTIFNN